MDICEVNILCIWCTTKRWSTSPPIHVITETHNFLFSKRERHSAAQCEVSSTRFPYTYHKLSALLFSSFFHSFTQTFRFDPKKKSRFITACELSQISRKFASVEFRVSMKSQLIKLLRETVITHLMTRQRFWSCQRENLLVKSLFRERVTWKCAYIKFFGLSCERHQVCSIEQTLSKSFSYLRKR